MYIDDSVAGAVNELADRTINWANATSLIFGCDDANNNKLNAHVADFYLNTDETLDISVEANRRKFIDAVGKPVDLGATGATPTGSQPAVFMTGAAASFGNVGYAGAFTLTGTLADAPSSPSD
jgi:hypothetical protein